MIDFYLQKREQFYYCALEKRISVVTGHEKRSVIFIVHKKSDQLYTGHIKVFGFIIVLNRKV